MTTRTVVLKVDKTTPEPWVSIRHKPVYKKGTRVKVIPADNMPAETGILFWVDEPEVADHPYGIALYEEDFYSQKESKR